MTLKFLCPECQKLVNEFFEQHTIDEDWKVIPNESDAQGEVEYVECVDEEFVELRKTYCTCGFETFEWSASDFLVEVNEKDKTIKLYGAYWQTFKDDFIEIVKELGYKPLVEQEIAANQ